MAEYVIGKITMVDGNPRFEDVNARIIKLLTPRTETTTYTIVSTDDLVRCNGTFTVNLPAAIGSGKVYQIKNIGTGTITINGNASDTIDTELSVDLTIQNESLSIVDAILNRWDII